MTLKKKVGLASFGLLSLVFSSSARAAVIQTADVLEFPNGPQTIGEARLTRNSGNVELALENLMLDTGTYTIWWLIFNDPSSCDGSCGLVDFEADVNGSGAFYAAGGFVDGIGNFPSIILAENTLPTGMDQVLRDNGGLLNSFTADIVPIVRFHGPIIPGLFTAQITQFNGGCDINDCFDVGIATFEGVSLADIPEPTTALGSLVFAFLGGHLLKRKQA